MSFRLSHKQIDLYTRNFKLFDKKNDGSINSVELGTIMRAVGYNPLESDIKDIINDINPVSGTLTLQEFLNVM